MDPACPRHWPSSMSLFVSPWQMSKFSSVLTWRSVYFAKNSKIMRKKSRFPSPSFVICQSKQPKVVFPQVHTTLSTVSTWLQSFCRLFIWYVRYSEVALVSLVLSTVGSWALLHWTLTNKNQSPSWITNVLLADTRHWAPGHGCLVLNIIENIFQTRFYSPRSILWPNTKNCFL